MMEIKNIYIETYGCSANQNNSEIMSGLLQQAGLNIVSNPEIADVVILNTCIVKGHTEQRMFSQIKKFKSRKLVVAGCLPDVYQSSVRQAAPNAILVSTHRIKDIAKAVKHIAERKKIDFLDKENEVKLCLPKIRQNKIIGITQISEGCLGNCSFCITKLAKGKLFSYPQEKILENIKRDTESGCKEIWITSQDNAAYGMDDNQSKLPLLLKNIFSLKGKFMIRIGMMNPNNLLAIVNELIECYKDKKMFKFLHIPLQSGSEKVIKDMNRQYKVKDFLEVTKKFRKEFPDGTISTDIIVGYPTESEEDFKKTIEIIEKTRPLILNVSRFWRKKGTKAAEIQELDAEIVKKRASELQNLHTKISLEENQKMLGAEFKCLVDKKGFNDTWLARNSDYRLVIIQGKNLLGKFLNVRIKEAKANYLIGEII